MSRGMPPVAFGRPGQRAIYGLATRFAVKNLVATLHGEQRDGFRKRWTLRPCGASSDRPEGPASLKRFLQSRTVGREVSN